MTFDQYFSKWFMERGDKYPPEILQAIHISMKKCWDFQIMIEKIIKTGNINKAIKMADAFNHGKTLEEIGEIK